MSETPSAAPVTTDIPAGIPRGPGLKLNIGCGFNKLDGYVNVDGFPDCGPDVIWDLERTPWPFPEDSVDEIVAHHVLEHIGQATDVFFAIVKEIYRVLRHGGEIRINVPHPLHR
jgi:predicted SAM-dependent methyltransferase